MRCLRRAFTLLELLISLVVLGVLIALISAIMSGTREEARKVQCVTNLRKISAMLLTFVTDNRGAFPLNSDSRRPLNNRMWQQRIHQGAQIEPQLFRCPNVHDHREIENPAAHNYYYYFAAFNSTTYGLSDWLARLDATAPTSSIPVTRLLQIRSPGRIVMLSERGSILLSPSRAGVTKNAIPWYGMPKHRDGVNVAFVDGHIEFITGVQVSTHWRTKLDDDLWWNPTQ